MINVIVAVLRLVWAVAGYSPTPALAHADLYYDAARVIQEVGWAGVTPRVREGTPGTLPQDRLPVHASALAPGAQPPPGGGSEDLGLWGRRRLERECVWAADPGAYIVG